VLASDVQLITETLIVMAFPGTQWVLRVCLPPASSVLLQVSEGFDTRSESPTTCPDRGSAGMASCSTVASVIAVSRLVPMAHPDLHPGGGAFTIGLLKAANHTAPPLHHRVSHEALEWLAASLLARRDVLPGSVSGGDPAAIFAAHETGSGIMTTKSTIDRPRGPTHGFMASGCQLIIWGGLGAASFL